MKTSFLIFMSSILLVACNAKQRRTEVIDSTLQTKVTQILDGKMNEYGTDECQAIVMNVKTGQIMALVGEEFTLPHRSEMIRSAILLAALESGKLDLNDSVDTGEGILIVGKDTLYDSNWHRGGSGVITVKQAFACNSTIGTYKLLNMFFGSNTQSYIDKLKSLGYGKADNIKSIGKLSEASFSNYGEWANITPVQTLSFITNIAKGESPAVDSLKSAMHYIMTNGFGVKANSKIKEAAGISATTLQEDGSYWAEFCGFFPYKDPQYSVMVALHKKEVPVSGGAMAGPIFKEIIEIF